MAASRWYFPREQIKNSPSVRSGIDYAKELGYRQQCANFIQDIGQRLTVNQLCINTSIVYMHRFYMFHSFKDFHRNVMAPCFLFLGAKVEEQPRKLEHVLKVAYRHLHKDSDAQLDNQSDEYMQMAQDLIDNESILLQTLGFELSVEHPHTYVVKCAQMVKAAKDLAQTSYFLATNSLHLTTFCIEQKPTVVACVCIYVACKWTSYEIPESHDKKHWWEYMDNEVTLSQIEDMTTHFIKILDGCPARLKKKISAGPVIYKGGVLQLKRENEDESDSVEKHNGASSSKTSSKDGSSSTEKHSVKSEHSSDSSKIKERKEHSSSLHSSHKHSKHPDGTKHIDMEKKQAEHQKHRSESKHRHIEHNKRPGEHSKQDESLNKQISRKRSEQRDNTMELPEIKSSSSISRPVEKSKPKETPSEEPSAAAKLILSLPPLQHKHSLPDQDQSMSDSPAKKAKLDSSNIPMKQPKLESDASKHSGHSREQISGSHHKHHKSSHSKTSSSKDKHREKISSDKHLSHQHKQQSSHKSSHSQKHHSKSQHDLVTNKLSETDQSSASDVSISESPSKQTRVNLGFKRDELTNTGIKSSQHHKSKKTPQKSDRSVTPIKTPHKSQGNVKLTPKKSKNQEESLPPPPPPPSVDMMSMLSSPPMAPQSTTDLYGKQAITPSKGQNTNQLQYGIQSDSALLQNQGQLHQVQQPNSALPMTPQRLKTSHAGQTYPQQQQQQFINTSQPVTSPATNYGLNQMYAPPSHNPSLFSPQAVNLIPPPMPPPGMILKQVSGLPPPPPPLNIPFPPPP